MVHCNRKCFIKQQCWRWKKGKSHMIVFKLHGCHTTALPTEVLGEHKPTFYLWSIMLLVLMLRSMFQACGPLWSYECGSSYYSTGICSRVNASFKFSRTIAPAFQSKVSFLFHQHSRTIHSDSRGLCPHLWTSVFFMSDPMIKSLL